MALASDTQVAGAMEVTDDQLSLTRLLTFYTFAASAFRSLLGG